MGAQSRRALCGAAWGAGWGLVAPYAMLVNAICHLGASIWFRAYNPGVVTSAILFLPLSVAAIAVIGGSPELHLAGCGLAVLLHVAIIGDAIRRLKLLRVPA